MYFCGNCNPDKVVHAGHGDLALGLLTGLPQPPGEVHVYVHVHAFHFTPQVDGAFNAIKGLAKCCSSAYCLPPLRLRRLSLLSDSLFSLQGTLAQLPKIEFSIL